MINNMNTNVYQMVKTAMVMPYQAATGPSGSQAHEQGGEYGQRNVERCGGYGNIAALSIGAAAAGLAGLGPTTRYVQALTPGKAAGALGGYTASKAWDNRQDIPQYLSDAKQTATDLTPVAAKYGENTLKFINDIKPQAQNMVNLVGKNIYNTGEDAYNYLKRLVR